MKFIRGHKMCLYAWTHRVTAAVQRVSSVIVDLTDWVSVLRSIVQVFVILDHLTDFDFL